MESTFISSFFIMLEAVGRIFLIIFVSGLLVRKKVITQQHIKSMADITVNILLPCLLFSSFVSNFDPHEISDWWLLPLSCLAMIFFGLGMGYLFFPKSFKQKQHLFPLASMQNAIYLVLPIGRFIFPDQFSDFLVYSFLFIIGFTPVAWSLGKVLITGRSFSQIKVKEFITPPFVVSVGTVLFVLSGLHRYVPHMVLDSVSLVGEATIPVSNIVLGATLGTISLKKWPPFFDIIRITSIKFLFTPLATIALLYLIGLKQSNPLLASLIIIESAAAPATALILQVRTYGGDKQATGSIMLLSYLLCILAIPLWIALWETI